MRITKQNAKRGYRKRIGSVLALFAIATLVTLAYRYWPQSTEGTNTHLFCGAEDFSGGKFHSNGVVFTTNCSQDTKTYVSGRASCRCEGDKRYGPTASIDNLKPGDSLFVSLHVKSTKNSISKLIFSSDKNHYHQEIISEGGDTAWKEYSTYYIIPEDADIATWKVYPTMAEGSGPAYYDDLKIGFEKSNPASSIDHRFPALELQINSLNFKKIKEKRKEAKKIGLLFSSKNDLVDANIKVDDKEYSCLTRLKGDLLDHLRSDKWSFRIMLDKNELWKGMKVFSIHNSKARSHLAEWTMHQMMRSEGIISPKYDFMQFALNGKNIGVYAYEQHFDNHFLTDNKKLIGPILRHNDEGYWDNVLGKLKDYEWAESSQIELFNKENEGDPQFMKLFHYGHSQLNDYLDGRKKADEVFDINKMAKYYALMEIGHGLHAQLMTNIRFYVNPTTGLMEPIGYDFFGDHMPNINEHWRPIGQWENGENIIERSRDGYAYMRRLFGDLGFYTRYMYHLERFSAPEYLDNVQNQLETQIQRRADFIRTDPEYANYTYDLKHQYRKAEYTRAKLYPMPNVSLKSYRSDDKSTVVLQGFHYFPLKIIGYKTAKSTVNLKKPILINAYSPDSPVVSHPMAVNQKPTTILYQTLGLDSIFYHEINNTAPPEINIETQQSRFVSISSQPDVKSTGASHFVKTKRWVINAPLIVEKGSTLEIPKGTQIEFKRSGSLTVKGNILALGTNDAPILFSGTKSPGQGILISSDEVGSQFSHCSFSNLDRYAVGAVSLPACINIDKSNVSFIGCVWDHNDAEVDLILSNSQYQLTHCIFQNNAGEAIRTIFSKGSIDALQINNYGGNGIVQKGGRSDIKNIHVSKLLGWAFDFDLMAISTITNLSINESSHGLRVSGSSDVNINEYKGITNKRDIEVTGTEQPVTRLIISNAENAKRIKYMSEPGVLLKINGSEKKTK